jgi:DHA1 family solute carrier family 18 vesicular amine transporter 1/2
MADLAAVGHSMDIGFAHVYGVFNLAYGLGNAVGPVIGGQVYDHVRHGWAAVCYICIGMFALAATGSFFCAGVDPLAAQLRRRLRGRKEEKEAGTPV